MGRLEGKVAFCHRRGTRSRGEGGAVIITSSTAELSGMSLNTTPGQAAYEAAKHGDVSQTSTPGGER
jgi:hypothetical protein